MDAGGASTRLRLEPRASSVSTARKLVRRTLTEAGHDDLADAAELVTSELVTNALVHAGSHIDISVDVRPDSVRVEIADGSPHLPTTREYGTSAGTGRGLVMVEEIADCWGVTRRDAGGTGKVVWFEIGTSESTGEPAAEERLRAEPRGDVVPVRLLNVPLLLHAAWQRHAEALLREYMLATLDDRTGDEAVQVHAEASDALALLAEHLPHPDLGEDPEHMLATARDPAQSCADVEVPVPTASVAHFSALDRAMNSAIDAANRNLFLTPPTQPELQAFRRWVCRQVADQSGGGAPEAWSADELESWVATPPSWDTGEVTAAEQALVAIDDTNTIIAVSHVAASLLGYDDPAELVGRRLVAIVPPAYRQAHLAGFTLHLYSGRRPLLDRTTTMPVLRRDGTELPVDLTVRSHVLPGERTVFTALLEV
jgi:PAS domain S-box-containing protein